MKQLAIDISKRENGAKLVDCRAQRGKLTLGLMHLASAFS